MAKPWRIFRATTWVFFWSVRDRSFHFSPNGWGHLDPRNFCIRAYKFQHFAIAIPKSLFWLDKVARTSKTWHFCMLLWGYKHWLHLALICKVPSADLARLWRFRNARRVVVLRHIYMYMYCKHEKEKMGALIISLMCCKELQKSQISTCSLTSYPPVPNLQQQSKFRGSSLWH